MQNIIQKLLWTQVLALVVIAFLLYPQSIRYLQIVRGILAFLFILYIPGYRLSYVFFKSNEISHFERFMMSFAISLLFVSFVTFYLHYFEIPVYHIYVYIINILLIVGTFRKLWIGRKK